MHIPFYDPEKSYEANFADGPSGAFLEESIPAFTGEKTMFLGFELDAPLGIPAGPLLHSKYVEGAFRMGFSLPTFKTVRTRERACHPWPNVVPIVIEGDLTLEKAAAGLIQADFYSDPIAITNSFGVPCPPVEVWQADMKKAVAAAGPGQVMIASYQGTNDGNGSDAFIADFVLGAKLVKETGAKIIEINLSCPNEGKAQVLCQDTDMVEKIAIAVKAEVGETPVLLKMPYYTDDDALLDFVDRLTKIIDGLVMINTIAGDVRKPNGEQALPGEGRLRSGICGAPIMWAGMSMVKRVVKMRAYLGRDFVIVGTGGVTTSEDYHAYIEAGADAVMSATGAMWNPYLAKEILETLN